jgi:hypothetical protein
MHSEAPLVPLRPDPSDAAWKGPVHAECGAGDRQVIAWVNFARLFVTCFMLLEYLDISKKWLRSLPCWTAFVLPPGSIALGYVHLFLDLFLAQRGVRGQPAEVNSVLTYVLGCLVHYITWRDLLREMRKEAGRPICDLFGWHWSFARWVWIEPTIPDSSGEKDRVHHE